MFTKKKLSIFLLIVGLIMFQGGVYCCYKNVEFKKTGPVAGAGLPAPILKGDASFTITEALTCTTLFAFGALMIGTGCYLMGWVKARNAHSFKLDFSGRTGNQEHTKI